jgi:hypothetical protein
MWLRQTASVPIGIYLECGTEDDPSVSTTIGTQMVREDRIASTRNLEEALTVLVQIFLADLILVYWVPRNEGLRA